MSEVDRDIADLYRGLGLQLRDVLSDPSRRRLDGAILQVEGVSGIATGGTTMFFDANFVVLLIGSFSNRRVIQYSEITALQFGGRGAFTTQSGGGWAGGGFGLEGALEGAFLAAVMNKLTTVNRSQIETLITFGWTGGQLVLRNTKYTPQQMASFLQPVLQRVEGLQSARRSEALRSPSQEPDLVERLRQLANLRSAGVITDEEFALGKARLLSSP